MSELMGSIEVDPVPSGDGLRRPPIAVTAVAGFFIACALVMFAANSQAGYGLAVLAMLANSVASFQDQKARADFNYVQLSWYQPTTVFLKLVTLLVAAGHILILAIESAR